MRPKYLWLGLVVWMLAGCTEGMISSTDPGCGDGVCASTEDCTSCPHDCGACSATCGNGVIDAGETCDPPATCPTGCDDGNACTTDRLTGSAASCTAACTHTAITTCKNDDDCCPSGCTKENDNDCQPSSGPPAGWLYTSGGKIYISDGAGGGTRWMGRGVNMDDIFLCGYNWAGWMNPTDAENTLKTIVSGLMSAWKPTFIRISLAMNSDGVSVSWLSNPSLYKTPMTNVINAIGANPNVYVLVTLRSDSSMVETDAGNEATYIPQAATDATYRALVDSFANSKFVIFGVCNEPGTIQSSSLVPVMSHAVSVIRAEEDTLGVPHHLVSVQGRMWTSDISFYSAAPLSYDNVVYEVHGYPPAAASYTYSNIPVIIGEYGSLSNAAAFFADIESKQIPNLAWDVEPYSDCAPDLLTVTQSATNLTPSSWGNTVKAYLLAH